MLYVNFLSFTITFPFNSKDNVLPDLFFLTNQCGRLARNTPQKLVSVSNRE